MKKKLIILFTVLIGFAAVYFFWPRTVELPKLGIIEDPQLNYQGEEKFIFLSAKPKLVTFFYTQCPDVCPMTVMDLTRLQQTLQTIGVGENEYDVILITLDPEVDTVEKIEQYKKHFDITAKNWFFLRGTVKQTRDITKQFNMAFKKDRDGLIVHSTTMYLLDANNQIRSYHEMNTGQKAVNLEQLAENIQTLIQ